MKDVGTKLIAMVGAVGIVMFCDVSALLAGKRATPETIVLLKRTASWNDVPYASYPQGQPELTTVRITIPAHSSLPWHTHDMLNAAYLLSGHLTVEERDTGRKATYRAGEAFAESVGNVHRGVTAASPPWSSSPTRPRTASGSRCPSRSNMNRCRKSPSLPRTQDENQVASALTVLRNCCAAGARQRRR